MNPSLFELVPGWLEVACGSREIRLPRPARLSDLVHLSDKRGLRQRRFYESQAGIGVCSSSR